MLGRCGVHRLAAVVVLLATPACGGYSKETAPLFREHVAVRVPNQQRLVALAVDDAVERLDFAALQGKRVAVEVAGIFPHSDQDALAYIRGAVEGKLARSGATVVTNPVPVVLTDSPAEIETGSALPVPSNADYRVVVGVSWAGVDTHDKKGVNPDLLTKQVLLLVGGVTAGLVLTLGVDDSVAQTIGLISMGAGSGGYFLWRFLEPPLYHTYRLIGRVRLSCNAIPLLEGQAFQTVGEGQTQIVIDPLADEGYVLQ
jgi:hypothetical protein